MFSMSSMRRLVPHNSRELERHPQSQGARGAKVSQVVDDFAVLDGPEPVAAIGEVDVAIRGTDVLGVSPFDELARLSFGQEGKRLYRRGDARDEYLAIVPRLVVGERAYELDDYRPRERGGERGAARLRLHDVVEDRDHEQAE